MKKIEVELSEDTYKKIEKLAERNEMSVEQYCFMVIEDSKNGAEDGRDLSAIAGFFRFIKNGDIPDLENEDMRKELLKEYLYALNDEDKKA